VPRRAPIPEGVKTLRVECLFCGEAREIDAEPARHVEPGECRRCGYLGWAPSGELSERIRRDLRERPPERRRRFAYHEG
jgi:hypothetical protein